MNSRKSKQIAEMEIEIQELKKENKQMRARDVNKGSSSKAIEGQIDADTARELEEMREELVKVRKEKNILDQ